MPYANLPESLWEKMDRCVDSVMQKQGVEKERAIAICHAQLAPEKALDINDDMLIGYGDAVKALGNGKIGGYLVRFGTPDAPDMEGEYFTKDTDFDLVDGERTSIYYHHGQDHTLERRKLGEGMLKIDEVGVWVEGQLALRDRYEQAIYRMAEAGKQSWSSGTAPHLVEREFPAEKATWIKRWPLRLDASITPTPAEPSTRVLTLKAYKGLDFEPLQVTQPQEDVRTPSAVTATKSDRPQQINRRYKTMDKRNIKPFANGFAVYESDGETIVSIHPTQDDATKALADGSKPDWLKAVELMQGMYEKNQQEFLKAFQAASASKQPGLFATGPEATVAGKYTFRDFLVAERMKDAKALKAMGSEYDEWEGTKVLGDQTGAAGGFLVPTQFLADLIRINPETEIVWPTADKINMTSRTVQVPGLDTTGSTAGQSNTMGGVFVQWNETGTYKAETEPQFTQIELVAHEISAYTEIKDALLQDSAISLAPLLTNLFRQSLMFYTDEAFLDGTGVGQPQGIVTAPGTLVLVRDTANHIVYEDIKNMFMHLMPQALSGAFWTINQFCMTELMDMEDTEGHLIWQPDARSGIPGTIFGLPVRWTEKTPTLGSQGDIILMSPSWYYIGQRQGVSIASSEHYKFRYNQTAYRCVMRVDGQEKLPAPVYAKGGTNQTSPFVVLGAGAS